MSSPDRHFSGGLWVIKLPAALLVVAATLYNMLICYLYAALRCDESCSETPGDWTTQAHAWEWNVFALLVLASLASGGYVLFSIVLSERKHVIHAAMAVGVVAITETILLNAV